MVRHVSSPRMRLSTRRPAHAGTCARARAPETPGAAVRRATRRRVPERARAHPPAALSSAAYRAASSQPNAHARIRQISDCFVHLSSLPVFNLLSTPNAPRVIMPLRSHLTRAPVTGIATHRPLLWCRQQQPKSICPAARSRPCGPVNTIPRFVIVPMDVNDAISRHAVNARTEPLAT